MQTTIADVAVSRAQVARISVGQLRLGPIDVGRLVVTDAAFGIHSGRAELRNVHITMRLRFQLVWTIQIPMPWPIPDIEIATTTSNLGALSMPFAFGDATVPGLQDMNFTVPELVAPDLRVDVDPVAGVELADVQAEGIRVSDVALPTAGFQIGGLGLTAVGLQDVSVPAARIGSAAIRTVRGAPVRLPALRLGGLALPTAAAGDITSGALDLTVNRDDPFETPEIDLGPLEVSLRVRASARMRVGQMRLSDVRASASARAIELRDVRVPFGALELTLSDLGLEAIEIPMIGVA